MSQINSLLQERLKKKESASSKAAQLARQSTSGNLSGFAGVFSVTDLTPSEKETLEEILRKYAEHPSEIAKDLPELISITSEVKAINNQAALLHGERIKKAHQILTNYREGAFTEWLLSTYGNRQTPYNFMQYFEFHEALPQKMRPLLEHLPRQAVYTLASRNGDFDAKVELLQRYQGETKEEILRAIRDQFPLGEKDRRRRQHGDAVIASLRRVISVLTERRQRLSKLQKETIRSLLAEIDDAL